MSRDIDDLRNPECGALVGEGLSGYGHDEAMADIFDLAHIETEFEGHDPRVTGLAAYIERLEAEYPCKGVMDCAHCEHRIPPDGCAVLVINARHKAERDAVVAKLDSAELFLSTVHGMNEMNVVRGLHKVIAGEFTTFHDEVRLSVERNAERVIHGE